MPELRWNESDFLEVLSVLPTNTDDVEYVFDVIRDGTRLAVTVWPCESVIGISLRVQSSPEPMADFVAFVRGSAVRRETRELEWIELSDVVIAPSRFSYLELGDLFDHKRFPVGFPVRIYITPQIRVSFIR